MNGENTENSLLKEERAQTEVNEKEDGKENKTDKRNSSAGVLKEITLYLAAFLISLIAFLLFKPIYYLDGSTGGAAQTFMTVAVGIILIIGIFWARQKKLTVKRAVLLFLAAGIILRVGYMLYTPATIRQHDTFSKNFDGHEAYAWTIFSTGKLPSVNKYQFYHPPLNAFLQAGFMRFMRGIAEPLCALMKGDFFGQYAYGMPDYLDAERYFLYSSCQILSVLYSVITCCVSLKLLKLFGVKGKGYLFAAAIVIFYPGNFQFAGRLNNDPLSYLFSVCALYFAVRWWKCGKRFSQISACGVSVGLGMMAKLSCATICLPIAAIFVYEFIRTLKRSEGALSLAKMIGEYALFLCICAPIGLWFQVYAKIRFDQPFGFVFSNLNHKLYTGDHSVFGRFFIAFDADEYFDSLWCVPFDGNYNLFHYALRSSIFGEFTYSRGDGMACAAVIFAYVFVLVSLVASVRAAYCFFKNRRGIRGKSILRVGKANREKWENLMVIFFLIASQVFSEIYFYITMPYACTMDFRYIMPLIQGIALAAHFLSARLNKVGDGFSVALDRCMIASGGLTLLFSSIFYLICG